MYYTSSSPPRLQGGVIGIKIAWMCDLDRGDEHCSPSYSFTRLDAMSQNNPVSPGYNFRSERFNLPPSGDISQSIYINIYCIYVCINNYKVSAVNSAHLLFFLGVLLSFFLLYYSLLTLGLYSFHNFPLGLHFTFKMSLELCATVQIFFFFYL